MNENIIAAEAPLVINTNPMTHPTPEENPLLYPNWTAPVAKEEQAEFVSSEVKPNGEKTAEEEEAAKQKANKEAKDAAEKLKEKEKKEKEQKDKENKKVDQAEDEVAEESNTVAKAIFAMAFAVVPFCL